ncbi:tubulin polyglutamylase complex subunit 2-like [Anopheles stephensi]|uniref:tubulin polyglutamylase complex subunit 2-like n=1 Tax=Anopheles stephensi TaxID=30069 RepID=UPI00165899FB|nr:tubulin polyglutamylase complex subunit 2-like [Anopheles stephensi]
MASRKIGNRRNDTSLHLEQLTFGLKNKLNELPRVSNVTSDDNGPCTVADLRAWEYKNFVFMPDDMKRFYMSTDGMHTSWTYNYSKRAKLRVGHLYIPKLTHIQNLELKGPGTVFELDRIGDRGFVLLVYKTNVTTRPEIYLLEVGSWKWTLLADSFTTYLRMTIEHLGLPCWQLAFASCRLPGWAEQLFLVLAPHLLLDND